MTIGEGLRGSAGELVEQLGLNKADKDKLLEFILNDFTFRLSYNLSIEIYDNLPENKKEEFQRLSAEGKVVEADQFAITNLPNLSDIFQKVVADFNGSYL